MSSTKSPLELSTQAETTEHCEGASGDSANWPSCTSRRHFTLVTGQNILWSLGILTEFAVNLDESHTTGTLAA